MVVTLTAVVLKILLKHNIGFLASNIKVPDSRKKKSRIILMFEFDTNFVI